MSASSPSDGPPPGVPAIQTAARLLAAGRAAEAAERLRQLVREAPTYAAAHVLLASALDAAGHPADALDVWRRAAFLVPHSPLVHRERQRLMDAQSSRPEAPKTEATEPETPEPETPTVEAWDTGETDPVATEESAETSDLDIHSSRDEQPENGSPEPDARKLDVADLLPSTPDARPADDVDGGSDDPTLAASQPDGAETATGEPDTDEIAEGDFGELASDETDGALLLDGADLATGETDELETDEVDDVHQLSDVPDAVSEARPDEGEPSEPIPHQLDATDELATDELATETISLSGTVDRPSLPGSAESPDAPEDESDLDARGDDKPRTDAEAGTEMLDLPLTETPLLPPEESPRPAPATSSGDDELEDDGWTIIEDDAVSPPRAISPEPTPLLPPESAEAPHAHPTEPPRESAGDSHVADDLDDLISQLDAAPRIKPDPTFRGPAVTFDESSVDDMASETLAKIYAAQHQYAQAARIYETLATREPDRADAHLGRAAELRAKASK